VCEVELPRAGGTCGGLHPTWVRGSKEEAVMAKLIKRRSPSKDFISK